MPIGSPAVTCYRWTEHWVERCAPPADAPRLPPPPDPAALGWIKQELERSAAAFAEVRHPRVISAQDLAHAEHFSGRRVAKVVVVMLDDARPVILVLPATRRVSWLALEAAFGGRPRLATEEELAGLFGGCELGAEPPLRHWPGIDLWMDRSLATAGEILFQAGTHLDAVRMPFVDWFRIARPSTADFSF